MDGSLVVDSCTLVLLQTYVDLPCIDLFCADWVCTASECKVLAHIRPLYKARALMIQKCVVHPHCMLDTHDLV